MTRSQTETGFLIFTQVVKAFLGRVRSALASRGLYVPAAASELFPFFLRKGNHKLKYRFANMQNSPLLSDVWPLFSWGL